MAAPDFTFAVIADSHFHPPGKPAQAAWDSDAVFNARNADVVEALKAARPDFVIHLGDVPHPVPGLKAHEDALDVAQRLYNELDLPFYVVPGNHDIGDKPHPAAPAPHADPALAERFAERWGPLWQAFEHDGIQFVLINTPVINTGLRAELEQQAWLVQHLAALRGQRWFAFLHYPPYLHRPDEHEHYDNIAEPGRSWLLRQLDGAEAVFCGHVHHFFWHDHGKTDIYTLPSTAFVRPGYSELSRIGPGDEFGRSNTDKLGWFYVHVRGDQHHIEPVRSHRLPAAAALRPGQAPVPPCPLGVTLRHALDPVVEIPADGLDPFTRKEARDDMTVLALWEAGIRHLRLPIADLLAAQTRTRLRALKRRGFTFTFFATAPLPTATREQLTMYRDLVDSIELVAPPERWSPPKALPVPWRWAPVARAEVRDDERFSHFPAVGFTDDGLPIPGRTVVRIPAEEHPFDARPIGDVGLVELPRGGESVRYTDDAAIACRVAEALLAAVAHPDRPLFLDAFTDHDRGYFPRNALLDRRGGPRAAHRVLCHLNRLLPRPATATPHHTEGARRFRVEGLGTLWLPRGSQPLPAGIDLTDGSMHDAEDSALPRLQLS